MKLYQHQQEALDLVRDKNRCAIYYDMGLGKTFIGSEKMKQLGATVNLIICQKSKIKDWIDHITEHHPDCWPYDLTKSSELISFLDFASLDDDDIDEITDGNFPRQLVGIINYELAWRRKELLTLTDFTLMLDESSLITNRTTKRSDFILDLKPDNVILLSGTPTAGKYEKLWSQLKLLGWNITEDAFWRSYVDYEWVDRDGFWDKNVKGYKNVDHLKKRLTQYGAIFKKTEEVLDLPDQVEQIIQIDPTKEYKKYQKHHYVEIKGKEFIGDNMLSRITHERQLCGSYNKNKFEAFQDLINSTEDRLVVFYNFWDEFDEMCKIAQECNRDISVVNGSEKDLSAYNTNSSSITFVQYQAGAYGLNLQMANKVIYFSLPLGIGSCDLWEQSKKRIHRIGQNRNCFYYYLLVKNSIETWNLELLKTGKELTDDLFKEVRI